MAIFIFLLTRNIQTATPTAMLEDLTAAAKAELAPKAYEIGFRRTIHGSGNPKPHDPDYARKLEAHKACLKE